MLKKRARNVIFSLLVIGLGILGFIIHEQKDDLRVIHTIAAVTKEWIFQILLFSCFSLIDSYEVLTTFGFI